MNTNHFSTFGTIPFDFFIPNEMSDPNFIYHFEIVDHTHFILCSVSLIQLFQPGAGEATTTTGAILGFAFGDLFTVSYFACSTVFRFLTFISIIH